MRLKNKYLRNRAYRIKNWKRIRNTEHPFETFCPYSYFGMREDLYGYDKQVENHFKYITERARYLETGNHRGHYNAPSWFRNIFNRKIRAGERAAMDKVFKGDYDALFPVFKKDANWTWF